jgi:hypothetical protein
MKRMAFCFVIFLIPASAMAGMYAISKKEMQNLNGQAGISLMSSCAVANAGSIYAIGDADGFGVNKNPGWFNLDNARYSATVNAALTVDIGCVGNGPPTIQVGSLGGSTPAIDIDNINAGADASLDSTAGGTSGKLGYFGVSDGRISITNIGITGH